MSKKDYIKFHKENNLPFFNQPWWLEIVSDGDWDCVIVSKKNNILGFLPYVFVKRIGVKGIGMPLLTQYINPILIYPKKQKYSKKLSFEKDVLQNLFLGLPYTSFVETTWGHGIQNWLPLYWLGYKNSSRYSYAIKNIKDLDAVFGNFETKIRGDIRKAERIVQIKISEDASVIYNLVSKTFERKKVKMPYSKEFLAKVVNGCLERNCGELTYAIDQQDNIHAAVFIVWDKESAYYLLGGGDSDYRNSGATSLLLWEGIKRVSTKVDCFDFEGSMMESIERFVRGFGACQTQLNQLSMIKSKSYFLKVKLKEVIKHFKR